MKIERGKMWIRKEDALIMSHATAELQIYFLKKLRDAVVMLEGSGTPFPFEFGIHKRDLVEQIIDLEIGLKK